MPLRGAGPSPLRPAGPPQDSASAPAGPRPHSDSVLCTQLAGTASMDHAFLGRGAGASPALDSGLLGWEPHTSRKLPASEFPGWRLTRCRELGSPDQPQYLDSPRGVLPAGTGPACPVPLRDRGALAQGFRAQGNGVCRPTPSCPISQCCRPVARLCHAALARGSRDRGAFLRTGRGAPIHSRARTPLRRQPCGRRHKTKGH